MSILQEQICKKSKTIHVDKYSMSIGEIINLYNDGEIDIHPEFQRFFRWSPLQKTKLIESLLLNIPIPPIFVSQRVDGIWDVVDGLQRISTILNFAGCYKDIDDVIIPPLVLEATDLLPALKGKLYNSEDSSASFNMEEKRYFKRAKLDMIILQKESDSSSKYELFQRLNTGGTSLSSQEVRNCIMVMISPDKFRRFEEMSKYPNFKELLGISDSLSDERYDMELVTRFVCLRRLNASDASKITDLSKFLNDKIIEYFNDDNFDIDSEVSIFTSTFDTIKEGLGDAAFCKYNAECNEVRGRFLVSAFEIIAIGLGAKDGIVADQFDIKEGVVGVWKYIKDTKLSWSGYSASGRLPKTLQLGVKLYNEEI